jgi:hypothetical protein
VKVREGLGGAGLPVLGAAGALAVCCTFHLIILAGGFGVLAAAALRWWPAAAAIAGVTAVAMVGVRAARWRGRGVADRCATGAAGHADDETGVYARRRAAIVVDAARAGR